MRALFLAFLAMIAAGCTGAQPSAAYTHSEVFGDSFADGAPEERPPSL